MGKRLWVERNKDGSWDAFSEDGAHIKFGKVAIVQIAACHRRIFAWIGERKCLWNRK